MLRIRVGIVDYRMGNLRSVEWALAHVGAAVSWVRSSSELEGLDVVLLPGVGAFPRGMQELERMDLVTPLRRWAERGRRLVGICLGFQMMFAGSEEGSGATGLGLLAGRVSRLPDHDGELRLKVPHIGWNQVHARGGPSPLDAWDGRYFYFVHSFAAPAGLGMPHLMAEYGRPFAAAAVRDNLWGAQFHPERSGADGLAFLRAAIGAAQ